MNTPVPDCPACRVRMQEGFVYDVGHHDSRHLRTRWVEGQPERSFLQGGVKIKGRQVLDTLTFRCPKCGWLIWFAPDAHDSEE